MKKLTLAIILFSGILLAVWNTFDHPGSVFGGLLANEVNSTDFYAKPEVIEREIDTRPDVDDAPDDEQTTDPKEASGKLIYLTFDDGPSSATSDILDTLKQYDVKATFFMLEPNMKKYPELVKRIVNEGHAVGMHGVTHDKNKFYRNEQTALDEMNQGQETLEKLTGIKSVLIRTPYGSVPYLLDSYRTILDEQGYKLWDWNVDSSDWSLSSEQLISTTKKQINNLEKADVTPIVLMHDKTETAKSLATLLDFLAEKEFQSKELDALIKPYNFNCYDRCKPLKK
ncbi:polysaccharide deacetylase [Paenibacillaceae bacterium]|nr:polysaccharide deacetylase [Paenibacillaceae bacterium]